MRKNKLTRILIVIILLFFIIIFYSQVFVPNNKEIKYVTIGACSQEGISRILLNNNLLNKWWPGQQTKDLLKYQDCYYKVNKILYSGINFTLSKGADTTNGSLLLIDGGENTTAFQWQSSFKFSNNVLKKIIQIYHFNRIENNVQNLLASLKKYFEDQQNVYGIKVEKQDVVDASLISLKHSFNHEPSVEEIYNLIDSLEGYINKKGSKKNNFPMLNIFKEDSINYQVMVALPTINELPSEGNFQLKKMVLGKILVTEVKGGNETIKNGLEQLTNYVHDYKKISPAISFQSLVTNRKSEPDTNKWITKLYYPIFN